MAKRLSTKEILEAARRGAPSEPAIGAQASSVPSGAEPEPEVPVAPEPSAAPTPPPAAPPSPGRPLTLKEKLAAARAGSGGGAAAAPGGAAKPAAAKPAAPVKAAAAKRELPPLDKISDPKDLAEALRQTGAKKDQEVAASDKAKEPVKPPKPKEFKADSVLPRPSREAATSGAGSGDSTTVAARRRTFLLSAAAILWLAWGSFVAGVTALTVMCTRFMFPNVLAEPPSTVKVGLPTNYEINTVNERFKAEWGFWIVRSNRYDGQDIIYALKSVCTHLGCPPNWLEGEQKFKCPCHGSGFYISGVNFEGPAPRPLERFKVSLSDDGQIVVDKSQIYQQELGQWSDPDSFVTG